MFIFLRLANFARFRRLQSRIHEVWARFFASTLEDDLRYTPSDCFRTFPFPDGFETDAALEATGEAYHAFRAAADGRPQRGLTKTYNRFHAAARTRADIVRLRELHAEMDAPCCAPMAGTISPTAPRPIHRAGSRRGKRPRPASTGRPSSRTKSSPASSPSTPNAPPTERAGGCVRASAMTTTTRSTEEVDA